MVIADVSRAFRQIRRIIPTKLHLMSITRVSSAGVLASALVLLAGCGGSSSSTSSSNAKATAPSTGSATTSSSSSSSASSSAPAASPSPTVTPATVVQLKKIVLRTTDLPRGWKGVPAQSDDSDTADQAELLKCVGAKNTDADKVATADSADFVLKDATISSTASSYKSQSSLDNDIALLKNPKLIPCFSQLLTKAIATSLPEGAKLGTVTVKFTPGPGAGPANVAGSGLATVPITISGQHVKVYVNFVYITGPLMEIELDAENVGAPVPAAVLRAAVKAVADRAAASS